jgi:hypothetical protein
VSHKNTGLICAGWRHCGRDIEIMVEATEGALGVGATFCLTGEFLGRRVPTIYDIIEYEPNRSAAWKTVSGALPMTFQRTFERVEGGTRFNIRYEAEVRGFFNQGCQIKSKHLKDYY